MHRIGPRSSSVEAGSKIAGMYDLLETLGRGHFAVVKLARHVFTGEKVAVKVIDKNKLDDVSRAHLYQEVRCMKLVQHPNVVRLYEVIDTNTKLYLILELGDGGDLYDYIMRHEGRGLDEETARNYFRQIVRAIDYCHRLHVVHRDLKPENVVFFETLGIVKLTDFGFSNRFCPGQKLETSCGSLAYSAPEILLGDSYDAPAVDVWSLGVILYMLVCGQAPFQEANDSETLTMIMDCKYTIPFHVSDNCKRLIARMLVREPDKRATLEEISHDAWLAMDEASEPQAELLPLVSREQVSDDDHAVIIQKMANGNIATKEEIIEALDKNEYNYITATYFLLAERRLKQVRQSSLPKRPVSRSKTTSNPQGNNNPLVSVSPVVEGELESPINSVNPSLLASPCTVGDVPGQNFRSRKCSIVAEEEDEEEDDIVAGSGSDDIASACSLNRRGSRSEGKLSALVKDRLAEVERRKDSLKGTVSQQTDDATKSRTTILKESSTVCIPTPLHAPSTPSVSPRYKSLPSPVQSIRSSGSLLNEIFEEGEGGFRTVDHLNEAPALLPSSRPGRVSPRTMTTYEQRRSKFHKTRTASCSSSDASDDDSESRKKRAHKLKNFPPRRDSHDDSSDSQDPGGGGGGGGGEGGGGSVGGGSGGRDVNEESSQNQKTGGTNSDSGSGGNSSGTGGGNSGGNVGTSCGAGSIGHRVGRRRARETRLRESQSLNRITEVQEAEPAAGSSPASAITSSKTKSLGTRILQGLNLKPSSGIKEDQPRPQPQNQPENLATPGNKMSSKSTSSKQQSTAEEKENVCNVSKTITSKNSSGKKIRLLGRYFQMHRKLCLPLFGRGRLYKAQSCSSLTRDRVAAPSDINQNLGLHTTATTVSEVCTGISFCQIHLGDSSKCCSLC
ncbi:SNF-related serine/threonine-protein kinase [Frankliniella fusca]|uniref:SNF-related serine/threonine-protein kinase n=1 Tax=Frankliniella fusca TaxID=407009 RepID=A0AAE1LA74_9NEOP|nr:SNF-related serine/threonine-protein kinase [Frankliniella fusca]